MNKEWQIKAASDVSYSVSETGSNNVNETIELSQLDISNI